MGTAYRLPSLPGRLRWTIVCGLWLVLGLVQLALFFLDLPAFGLLNLPVLADPQPRLLLLWLVGLFGLLPACYLAPRLVKWLETTPGRFLYLLLSGLGFVGYAAYAWLMYGGLPVIDDGASALYQARIFASGHVVLDSPPLSESFRAVCTVGPWCEAENPITWTCGAYPPAWSLLAAPFVMLGLGWLVNPLLAALLIPAVGWLGRELYSDSVGRFAALLTLLSPSSMHLAGTYLSHHLTALGMVVCAASVLRMLRTQSTGFGLVAGSSFAVAFLTRTMSSVILGMVLGLWVLMCWRKSLQAWKGVLLAGLCALAGLLLLLGYQQKIVGNWRVPGHVVALGKWGHFGLGQINEDWVHTPTKAVVNSLARLKATNEQALGWPIGMLAVLCLPLVFGNFRWREAWLLAFPLGLLSFFFFFWYGEYWWPGRYLFSGVPFLLILVAHGVRSAPRWGPFLLVAFGLVSLCTRMPAELDRDQRVFGNLPAPMVENLKTQQISRGLVFMADDDHYASGWIHNRLDRKGPLVFARDLGPEKNAQLTALYPELPVYSYLFDPALRQGHFRKE